MAASEDVHRMTQRATVYYTHQRIEITSEVFHTEYGRFRIRDLTAIGVGQAPRSAAGRVAGAIGTGAALVLFGVAMSTRSIVGLLAAAGIVLVWALAFALARRLPRWFELSAQHRGTQVTLLRTSDQVEFGQVRRALIRALESAQDGGRMEFGTAPPAGTRLSWTRPPGNSAPQVNRQHDPTAPADPRPPDEPAKDAPGVDGATVPPGLIDDAFAQYDELLLRVGPPPGWPASEGRDR